jgi:hypothetical protein
LENASPTGLSFCLFKLRDMYKNGDYSALWFWIKTIKIKVLWGCAN